MRRSFFLATVIALFCLSCAAQAVTISYTQSVPVSLTNWTSVLAFQQFDPTLGTLNSITFSMTSSCEGQGFAENMSTMSGSSFSWELSALVQLKRPDNSVLLQIQPFETSPIYNLGVYDGAMNFTGASGVTDPLNASDTVSLTTPPPVDDLALFTGIGSVDLTATATAKSKVVGGGNIAMGASTKAGVGATITYDYTPVPEPGSLVALLSGLGGLILHRRRK